MKFIPTNWGIFQLAKVSFTKVSPCIHFSVNVICTYIYNETSFNLTNLYNFCVEFKCQIFGLICEEQQTRDPLIQLNQEIHIYPKKNEL